MVRCRGRTFDEEERPHLIASSARARSDAGRVRPERF
jgi:hypothetical protein